MDREERLEEEVREALSGYPDGLEYGFDLLMDLKTKEQAIKELLRHVGEVDTLLNMLFEHGELKRLVIEYLKGE